MEYTNVIEQYDYFTNAEATKLNEIMNKHADEGWLLHSVTSGPRGTVILTFERETE